MKTNRLYEWIRNNLYLCSALYAVLYLVWFRFLEKTVTVGSNCHVMHCWIDDHIPFMPVFIIPYLLWFVYVAVAIVFFYLRDQDEAAKLGIFLAGGMTICLLICTLYPNGTDLRIYANPENGICSVLTWFIQSTDTPTNVFPSIHVYNAIGVNLAIWHSQLLKNRPVVRWSSAVLMFMICLSTMFLKQHSLLDVTGAVALAYLMNSVIYGRFSPFFLPLPEKKGITQPVR